MIEPKALVERARSLLEKLCSKVGRSRLIRVMHVCGTHEHTIARHGLRGLLPGNLEVIPGPGCPVCVCPAEDVDLALALVESEGVTLCTFGDMLRVPSSTGRTLDHAKAAGADVRVVYGPVEAVDLARENPGREFVFFSIGFETTAPVVGVELLGECPENLSIICANKTIPPAMELLANMSALRVDGFLCPGHVATVIGTRPFDLFSKAYRLPCVVAGFEPHDVMIGLYYLARMIVNGESRTVNAYSRVVRPEGNPRALEVIDRVFEQASSRWRGIGRIPGGGYVLKPAFSHLDAKQRFQVDTGPPVDVPAGCSCHLVIVGRVSPRECPLFGKRCTPINPVGPCMVSHEGTCNVAARYPSVDHS
ncbi:MAG: hydrogenase formation protein HypD [Promethearchaeota archaeon]